MLIMKKEFSWIDLLHKIFPKLYSPKNSFLISKQLTIRSAFLVILKKRIKLSFPISRLFFSTICRGQIWPTENPFKLILQASKHNQKIFEIIIGETQKERSYDVIFENGLPKLSEIQNEEEIIKWDKKPLKIVLKNKSNIGEDNLKLFFKITKNADLLVKCFDIKDEFFGEYNLGNIFWKIAIQEKLLLHYQHYLNVN